MKIQKNIIYNTFRCNSLGKKENINDILKGTKSILASKNGFQRYIHKYSIFTKKPTFKNPQITDYPLLKTESTFLIPIKKLNNNNSEDQRHIRIMPKKKIFFSNEFIQTNSNSGYLENYNKRFYHFLRLRNESRKKIVLKKRINDKKFKRYNTLFLDFFNKWNEYNNNSYQNSYLKENNKNKINNFDTFTPVNNNTGIYKSNLNININNFNMKERYAGLHYDENEIFNTNYDKFISKRINSIKVNKIKNYITYIESSFDDLNGKEIQLKLESIKVNFYPLKSKDCKNNEEKNNFHIYLPLSFVFLFYFRDMNFFQKILMSILYFEKDYKKVIFNDEGLYNLLKSINIYDKEDNKEDNDVDHIAIFKGKNSIIENNSFKINNRQIEKKDSYDKEFRKTFNKHKLYFNKTPEKHVKKDDRKIKIIHSNANFGDKLKIYYNSEEDKKNINIKNKEKDFFYNEYYFIWETPAVTYKVKIDMPKIFFLYEDINYNIITYCDKNLYLYLYKNNFINWDFYVLNYIFSIKAFRTLILQFLSLSEDYTLIQNSDMNRKQIINLKNISIVNKIEGYFNLIKDEKDNNSKKNLFITNRKIYNQMNENNESYTFFYSDSKIRNYILHFYSYHIKIEYKKLNPKLKWEFFLNFKQMRYLNEVSKYEQLSSFLPKIIITNFEYGRLNINFNVFDDNFNAKILDTESNNTSDIKKNNEINIEIDKPYVEMEKMFKSERKIIRQDLNYIFLQSINRLNMLGWSKKILGTIDNKLIIDKNELNKLDYFKSKYFINNGNINDSPKILNHMGRSTKQKLTYISKGVKNEEFILKALKKLKSHED